MKEINFWDEFCKNCDKRCCKKGPLMVLPAEMDKIVQFTGKKNCFENHGEYFILKGIPCPFLEEDGKCAIHNIKPLDCMAYPIFAKPLDDCCEWRVDQECPAHNKLPDEFIARAQELFLGLPNELRKVDWDIVSNEAGFKTKKLK